MKQYRRYSEDYIMETNNYAKHVSAMTAEKLHSKSDIALELAYRDDRIEELEDRIAKALAFNSLSRLQE